MLVAEPKGQNRGSQGVEMWYFSLWVCVAPCQLIIAHWLIHSLGCKVQPHLNPSHGQLDTFPLTIYNSLTHPTLTTICSKHIARQNVPLLIIQLTTFCVLSTRLGCSPLGVLHLIQSLCQRHSRASYGKTWDVCLTLLWRWCVCYGISLYIVFECVNALSILSASVENKGPVYCQAPCRGFLQTSWQVCCMLCVFGWWYHHIL